MSEERWEAIDAYLDGLFVPPDPALDEALTDSDAAGLPSIQISPTQGKFLHLLARIRGARRILEIGTLGGYSAIWLGWALPADGRLITLEAEPMHAEVATANLARAGLADVAEVRVGPALETLPRLAEEGAGPFDLVFIDADKGSYPDYLLWAIDLSEPGSVIVLDNVVWHGDVIEAPKPGDPDLPGILRANEMLGADPRLDATVLQTVGVKGHDGFAVAIVTGTG